MDSKKKSEEGTSEAAFDAQDLADERVMLITLMHIASPKDRAVGHSRITRARVCGESVHELNGFLQMKW